MRLYNVEIKEDTSRVIEINANSYEEAVNKAEEMYDKGEVVLFYDDCNGVSYEPYPSQKIKNNFSLNIEFDKKEKMLYITHEDGSGTKYNCETRDNLISAFKTYIDIYEELEPVEYEEVKNKYKDREER